MIDYLSRDGGDVKSVGGIRRLFPQIPRVDQAVEQRLRIEQSIAATGVATAAASTAAAAATSELRVNGDDFEEGEVMESQMQRRTVFATQNYGHAQRMLLLNQSCKGEGGVEGQSREGGRAEWGRGKDRREGVGQSGEGGRIGGRGKGKGKG